MPFTLAQLQAKGASQRDLGDDIYEIEKVNCPIISTLNKSTNLNGSANMLLEWPVGKLEAGEFNSRGEGDLTSFEGDFADDALIKNRLQFSYIPIMVGMLAEYQNLAGRTNGDGGHKLWATMVLRKMKKAKKSWEMMVAGDQVPKEPYTDGAEQKIGDSRGMGDYLNATDQTGTPSGYEISATHRPAAAAIYASTVANLVETGTSNSIQNVTGSIYAQTASKVTRTCYAGLSLKQKVGNWVKDSDTTTTLVRRINSAKTDPLSTVVSTTDNESGTIEWVLTPYGGAFQADKTANTSTVTAARGYLIDPANWKLVVPQNPTEWREPEQFGGRRGAIWWLWSLVCFNPRGDGAFKCTA